MTHEYGYNGTSQYADYLELEDNLNFAIEAFDADYLAYYLVVFTKLGQTSILEYGPLSNEDDIVPEESTIKYVKMESDEKKIDGIIGKFLGAKKKLKSHKKNPFDTSKFNKIVEVREISVEEALNLGINLFDFLRVEMGIKKEID